jgi:hypothetical protein
MRRAAVLLLILMAACSGGSDAEKTLKTARSWSATLDVAARGLAQHDLSPQYTRQVAEVAEREIAKQLHDADDASVRDACRRVIDSARRLRAACERP